MKYLFIILFSIISLGIFAQDNGLGQLTDSITSALYSKNLKLANQLLSQPNTKLEIDMTILSFYFYYLSLLAQLPEVSQSDRDSIFESALEQSSDLKFQQKYVDLFLQKEEYDYLQTYLDKVIERYPDNRLLYFSQKARVYERQKNFVEADKLNDKILRSAEVDRFDYWNIGEAELRYGQESYYSGDKKQKTSKYFERGLKNLRKAYDLFDNDSIIRHRIEYKLHNVENFLIKNKIMKYRKISKYMDGVAYPINGCCLYCY